MPYCGELILGVKCKRPNVISCMVLFSVPHNTQKSYVTPCLTSPTSRVVIYSQLSVCSGEVELFQDHLSNCRRLTRLRKATAKATWATFSTDTCMKCQLLLLWMAKSVPCCCVHGSCNLVTNLRFISTFLKIIYSQ